MRIKKSISISLFRANIRNTVGPTAPYIVGIFCFRLHVAEGFDRFQTLRNNSTRNNMQQDVQTDATSNSQQFWELLANKVASVCTGLLQSCEKLENSEILPGKRRRASLAFFCSYSVQKSNQIVKKSILDSKLQFPKFAVWASIVTHVPFLYSATFTSFDCFFTPFSSAAYLATFRRRDNLVPRFSLLRDGYERTLGTRLAAGKFSQNYFQESNDRLWNWISLKYSDQSTPYFGSIVLWPTCLNHTHSGFSFKDLFPLLMSTNDQVDFDY